MVEAGQLLRRAQTWDVFRQWASRIGSGRRRAQESKDDNSWGFVLSVRTGGGRFLRKNINESSLGPCEV